MQVAAVHIKVAGSRRPLTIITFECRLDEPYLERFYLVTKGKASRRVSSRFRGRSRVDIKGRTEVSGQMFGQYF
jgi:hypothetical protein